MKGSHVRTINYKTHWAYGDAKGIKRQAPLVEFVLDIVYLWEKNGVIPPLHVFNEVLQQGRNGGGMGPGTSWRPFVITETEYQELVDTMLNMDMLAAKKNHPYILFKKAVVDTELHDSATHVDWLKAVNAKYTRPR